MVSGMPENGTSPSSSFITCCPHLLYHSFPPMGILHATCLACLEKEEEGQSIPLAFGDTLTFFLCSLFSLEKRGHDMSQHASFCLETPYYPTMPRTQCVHTTHLPALLPFCTAHSLPHPRHLRHCCKQGSPGLMDSSPLLPPSLKHTAHYISSLPPPLLGRGKDIIEEEDG